jgi:hypothetical protein
MSIIYMQKIGQWAQNIQHHTFIKLITEAISACIQGTKEEIIVLGI